MKNTIINTIATYAQISVEDMRNIKSILDGNCYELSFDCELMHYDCYVDASGEVMGFMFSPIAYASTQAA